MFCTDYSNFFLCTDSTVIDAHPITFGDAVAGSGALNGLGDTPAPG